MTIQATLSGSGFTKPTLTFGVTNLQAALESFKNFSVADLVGVISRVVELLQSSDIDGLNTPIPVVNQTPNDILNVVGGLAKAAEELLAGPDLDLLNAKILELETLLNSLGGTPEQNDAVLKQIQGVKSFQNPDHVYQLGLPAFSSAITITGASNPANSAIVITTTSTSRLSNGQKVTIMESLETLTRTALTLPRCSRQLHSNFTRTQSLPLLNEAMESIRVAVAGI